MTRTKAHYRSVLTRTIGLGLLLAALMAASLMLLAAQPSYAQTTFTVTRADDFGDPDPADGECGSFAGRSSLRHEL